MRSQEDHPALFDGRSALIVPTFQNVSFDTGSHIKFWVKGITVIQQTYQYKISALICSDLLDLYSDGQSLFWLFSICITWFIKLCHMSSQPEPTDIILIIIICIVITHRESCHIIFFLHEVFANLWVCPYKLQKRFLILIELPWI